MKAFFKLASIVVIIGVAALAIMWVLDALTIGASQLAMIDTLLVVVIVAVASGLVSLVARYQ